jgi:hypothetical protein
MKWPLEEPLVDIAAPHLEFCTDAGAKPGLGPSNRKNY